MLMRLVILYSIQARDIYVNLDNFQETLKLFNYPAFYWSQINSNSAFVEEVAARGDEGGKKGPVIFASMSLCLIISNYFLFHRFCSFLFPQNFLKWQNTKNFLYLANYQWRGLGCVGCRRTSLRMLSALFSNVKWPFLLIILF